MGIMGNLQIINIILFNQNYNDCGDQASDTEEIKLLKQRLHRVEKMLREMKATRVECPNGSGD